MLRARVSAEGAGWPLVSRAFPAGLAKSSGNGYEVLLAFQIQLSKCVGKKAHAVIQRGDPIGAAGRRRCRLAGLRLKRDVLKKPEYGNSQELSNLAQHPSWSLISTGLVGVIGTRINTELIGKPLVAKAKVDTTTPNPVADASPKRATDVFDRSARFHVTPPNAT
jgi:hypothetical protein